MKLLEDIPGMKEELELVGHTMRECVADSLGRQPLSKIIEEILASDGKYLRPALVLIFGRIGMAYPACRSKLVKTAAVVELIHMASLIHDDIVDDAPSRRGRDTIQSAFGKDMAVYAASKSAQENLVRNVARQVAAYGITVNNLAPGVFATDRNEEALSNPEYAKRVTDCIPARTYAEPSDAAGAALLLCSDAGRYITGANLVVDGGLRLPG